MKLASKLPEKTETFLAAFSKLHKFQNIIEKVYTFVALPIRKCYIFSTDK